MTEYRTDAAMTEQAPCRNTEHAHLPADHTRIRFCTPPMPDVSAPTPQIPVYHPESGQILRPLDPTRQESTQTPRDCTTCGAENVEDAGDHADQTGHWPTVAQCGADVVGRWACPHLKPCPDHPDAPFAGFRAGPAYDVQRDDAGKLISRTIRQEN